MCKEDVSPPQDARRRACEYRPSACTRPKTQPLDDRLDRRGETPRDEELRIRVRRKQRGQRLEPELEPVRLVLVAAEKQHGAAARRMLGGNEVLDIDRVVQHLPGPGGLAHALVRGSLAELALVEDVISLPQNPVQRSVEGLGARSCPAGVSDTVLVDDQRIRRRRAYRRSGRKSRGSQVDPRYSREKSVG